MALAVKINLYGNDNISIVNPLYPINGRMCTMEDLFVQYNQLNLLNNSYRLLEPDKDLCPSVQDIYNDNIKVYYIEEDIYQELQKEDASIYFYNYKNPSSLNINIQDATKDGTDSGVYTRNTTSSITNNKQLVGSGEGSQNNTNYRKTESEVYKQFTKVGTVPQVQPKYANYWAIYMRDDIFTSYIRERMIQYFNTYEVTENDSKDVLFNILATRIREQQRALGKDVFLKEQTRFSTIWTSVATILTEFFEDVFMNLRYKNEYVFYSQNTYSSGIKALNIMRDYWRKIDPNYNPDQTKCRFTFQVAQDVNGYYIKTTSPIEIKKYLCREITDISQDGTKRTYLKYINMDDIEDMSLQLMHWIQKNFIYLPYHIPNIGVNTDGTQHIYINNDNNISSIKVYENDWKNREATGTYRNNNQKFGGADIYPTDIYTHYKNNENKCLVRMCDIQQGYMVFSDDSHDYTENSNGITTSKSNTAFLYDQIDTTHINDYALAPENYKMLNAEFEEKYYTYLCSIDIGDNNIDVLEITPGKNVKYSIQKTFYEKNANGRITTFPIYNIAFMPNKKNTSGNILTYTASITQKLSGIVKEISFRQYPSQFIVFPELNELSSKYHYEIERFNITSPVVKTRLLNVNNNTYTQSDATKHELVIYQHQIYKINSVDSNKGRMAISPLFNPTGFDNTEIYIYRNETTKEWENVKRLNQNTSNTYYLLSYMTDTQDITKEMTMEITISVYDNYQYNQWKQYGYWTDSDQNKRIKLFPMDKYEIDRYDSCNIIIDFFEIDNYLANDEELVSKNKNSLHKYIAGRTDLEIDTQFNTLKFSNTSTVAKNVVPQFATGYTSWISGKKVRLKVIQHIDGGEDTYIENTTENENQG